MKFKDLACALLVAVGMASCTAESDAPVMNEETTVSLEKTFNARNVDYQEDGKNSLNLSELTPVSVEEANNILKVLREKKDAKTAHSVSAKDGEPGQTFLTVSAEQQIDGRHKLTLQMTMITYADDGSLYYKDYRAFAASDLYKWHMTGFGLSTAGPEGMYKIEGTSNLYFKVVDEGVRYIQVPVKVTGSYNPKTHEANFAYSI